MYEQDRIARLNAPTPRERLEALRALTEARHAAGRERPAPGRDVNNHIHTTYSFSPYSPAKAVWMAAEAGLATAGLMDHDSIGGAREFIEAGRILGLPTTIGAECRASFAATPLAGRRINNPDQETIAYVALHGVPHSRIDALTAFFEPVRQARAKRNREMTARLNVLLEPAGIARQRPVRRRHWRRCVDVAGMGKVMRAAGQPEAEQAQLGDGLRRRGRDAQQFGVVMAVIHPQVTVRRVQWRQRSGLRRRFHARPLS